MMYCERGSTEGAIDDAGLRAGLREAFEKLGKRSKVLAIPPDFTRFHSKAGRITEMAWEHYGQALTDVLPALGTHFEMTDQEKTVMFGATPKSLFRVHKWREDVATLGRIPGDFIKKVSEGRLSYDWPAQVNKLLVEGGHDLILSIGQVVPHEVMGMAGYNKNIFVGTGGREAINKSHYIGAVYGMERMMGRADTPVRAVLNRAAEQFTRSMPIVYVLTVVGREPDGKLALKGLFVGDDHECFHKAADLSLKVNFTMVDEPLAKVVVYLDPSEFKSTWLGNKAIYRTRMAIADGGELIVLGPGVKQFGEDPAIDGLIRKYGYHGTPHTLKLVDENDDLRDGLGVAAHLIHGSSEGRFSITYCAGGLSRAEVEAAGFQWADLGQMTKRYDPSRLREGWNELPGGDRAYYISNPAIGLWSSRDRFKD
jgi:nickel-dependent lactate racemase